MYNTSQGRKEHKTLPPSLIKPPSSIPIHSAYSRALSLSASLAEEMAAAVNMALFLLLLLLLCFLGLTVAAQENIHIVTLYEHDSASSKPHLAVELSNQQHLKDVSSSVLKAETWLRTHVLSYFPSSNITTILVHHHPLECPHNLDPILLPTLTNIHYSLTRWGLHNEIKVSPALSPHCFHHHYTNNKPLLHFLNLTHSTFTLILPSSSRYSQSSLNPLLPSLPITFKFLLQTNHNNRKLSQLINPYPARPTPLPQTSQPPIHSSSGNTIPSHSPASAPYVYENTLPPCNPSGSSIAPAPEVAAQKLWCVAKPSVPEQTLQEALDYACGEGGADCDEIKPTGSCFHPDTVLAHASYAFNSYWQKYKKTGGGATCSFGGTAIIINSDPSFLHCRFLLY
ncbi:Glucan endo-1,3-beta-glucosidase 4 [Linum grandiflorum]